MVIAANLLSGSLHYILSLLMYTDQRVTLCTHLNWVKKHPSDCHNSVEFIFLYLEAFKEDERDYIYVWLDIWYNVGSMKLGRTIILKFSSPTETLKQFCTNWQSFENMRRVQRGSLKQKRICRGGVGLQHLFVLRIEINSFYHSLWQPSHLRIWIVGLLFAICN